MIREARGAHTMYMSSRSSLKILMMIGNPGVRKHQNFREKMCPVGKMCYEETRVEIKVAQNTSWKCYFFLL